MKEKIKIVGSDRMGAVNNHSACYGTSGAGKTGASEFIVTSMMGTHKVIDCWNPLSEEGWGYVFPQTDQVLIELSRKYSRGMYKPRSFKTQFIAFAGSALRFEKSVPECFEIVSLDPTEITIADLTDLIARQESGRAVLAYIEYKNGSGMNILELKKYLEETDDPKVPTQSKYFLLRQISRYLNSGLFNDAYPRLDLNAILSDMNTLTSFHYIFLEEPDKALAVGLLLKEVVQLKRSRAIKNPVLCYVRETSDFFSRWSVPEMSLPQKELLTISKQGRRVNLNIHIDCQRPSDVPPSLRKNIGTTFALKSDLSEANALRDIVFLPDEVIFQLPGLKRGTCVVMGGGAYRYPVLLMPPLHQNAKEGMDGIQLLKDAFGTKTVKPKKERTKELISSECVIGDDEVSQLVEVKPREPRIIRGIKQFSELIT